MAYAATMHTTILAPARLLEAGAFKVCGGAPRSGPASPLSTNTAGASSVGQLTCMTDGRVSSPACSTWRASPRSSRSAHRVLGGRDVVDDVSRSVNEVTLDHKLPMKRWDEETSRQQTDYQNMSDEDIRERFQLLKKSNGNVSHNLLKSRACEECFENGKRGTPFGIHYFYAGNDRWEGKTLKDPNGCVGCGWFDVEAWRTALNRKLSG